MLPRHPVRRRASIFIFAYLQDPWRWVVGEELVYLRTNTSFLPAENFRFEAHDVFCRPLD